MVVEGQEKEQGKILIYLPRDLSFLVRDKKIKHYLVFKKICGTRKIRNCSISVSEVSG